jgi:hypothetical protein
MVVIFRHRLLSMFSNFVQNTHLTGDGNGADGTESCASTNDGPALRPDMRSKSVSKGYFATTLMKMQIQSRSKRYSKVILRHHL